MFLVLTLWLLVFVIDAVADALNLRSFTSELPEEFKSTYDSERYAKSRAYLRDTTRFGWFRRGLMLAGTVVFLVSGGFEWADQVARGLGWGPIATGLAFFGVLSAVRFVAQLPFSVYDTFGIEARYGFNRSTPAVFVGDLVKGLVLSVVLGAPALAAVLWFFGTAGESAWLYSWIGITAFQLVLLFLAPAVILPLFNKFEPVPDGELRKSIEDYARKENFLLQGIYVMDGSRRSSKSNAYFTGFGRFRRLVLFDTLVKNHTVPELTGVLAHEIGHFKLKHIPRSVALSIGVMGATLYLFSLFLNHPWLFEAFRMSQPSVYASLLLISLVYGPLSRPFSLVTMGLSRKHEFEADAFAARTTGKPDELAAALKKLSADNLSNLTPHPFKVLLDYTHPPVLQRIRRLRELKSA